MATYGQSDFAISVDNSGGTPVDITAYVMTIGGVAIEAITEESDAFGDSWVENSSVGVSRFPPFTIGGIYNDQATTGPDAILNSPGDTRTVTLTWGGSKTTEAEMIISRYSRMAQRGALTKYECEFTPAGAATEA